MCLYLKGRFHVQQHTPAGFHKAIEYFQQATEQEPNYALAFAGLSSVLIFQWFFGFVSADEAIPKAKNVALRALELNSNLDEAHIALAHIRMFYERDLKSAEHEYGEAIQLNPNNAYARYQYGLCLAVLGKREQAIVEAEKAIELEPLSVLANFQVAAIYYQLGLFEESSRYSQRLIEMASGFYGGYLLKGAVLSAQGEFVEAIRLLEKALMLDKSQDFTKSLLGQACGLAGNNTRASELIEELQNEREKRYVNAFDIARIYSSLRDVDKTVEWLGKAVEEQNGELVYLKLYANQRGGDIWGEALRSDKRFQDLLRRIYSSTDEPNQTAESLEAQTAMLSEPPVVAGDLTQASQEQKISASISPKIPTANLQPPTTADGSDLPAKPKSKWWLVGLLTLLLAVGGFFGYKYLSPTTKQINSIAVLPFENRSSDADTDYLSDGLAESLIYRLSQLPDLKVSPTSSVFRYKGKATDPDIIAKELGVESVLTGRIMQRGDNLTISVNLVDTRNGTSLWGEQYERKMSELLATQREIAAEITNNLKLKLSGESEQKLAKKYTDNNEAYQLYLRGRFHFARRTKDDILKGIDYFQQAIKLDPNFALAYASIADSYNSMGKNADLPPKEVMPQAKAAATRALEIDPTLAEAHGALADSLALYDWNWAESEREYGKAFQLDPNVSYIHLTHGVSYSALLGKRDEAVAELKRAVELEPLSLITNAIFGLSYSYENRARPNQTE